MVTIEEFLVWIGMAGALIGGALFNILKIDLGLANIVIRAEDLVSAFLGSLVFLGLFVVIRKWLANRENQTDEYE